MAFTYYLPEILFGLLAVVAVVWIGKVVWTLLREAGGKASCIHCKGTAVKESEEPYLFLIPVNFGDTYGNAEEYLSSHMTPIQGKEQIPTGMRACWLEVYRCSQCDKQQVKITDFLQVRGEESVKGSYEFPYESFWTLIERWRSLASSVPFTKRAGGPIQGKADTHIRGRGEL